MTDPSRQTLRDRHTQFMADRGRSAWQDVTECSERNHAGTAMNRIERLIGLKLRARTRPSQGARIALAIQVFNRVIRRAKSMSVTEPFRSRTLPLPAQLHACSYARTAHLTSKLGFRHSHV